MAKVRTLEEVRAILSRITFAPSCIDMGWQFDVKEIEGFFLLRTSFKRPDTQTGETGTGFGGWQVLSKDSPVSAIVKRGWVCIKMVVEHELMEGFLYRGARLFNPHKSLTDLAYPMKLEDIQEHE